MGKAAARASCWTEEASPAEAVLCWGKPDASRRPSAAAAAARGASTAFSLQAPFPKSLRSLWRRPQIHTVHLCEAYLPRKLQST
ncbi:hypothetical protein GHT09_010714 [Marmota monax]|uniref:Uncharacterized protein n=1 Tax=Marmota monax TaxID=9995 RepID=A0A834QKM8_MARMO|nr:hypothetical protein GHT09_010714 [Marmota monax]